MIALEHLWQAPADHPALPGHFPGRPIVPGVVLLDRVMLLAQQAVGGATCGWQVSQAKFLSPCGPADALQFALRESARGGLAFTVRCGDRDIASGSLQAPSL